MGGRVISIEAGSIADELGWRVGDEIVSINGHPLCDVLDYRFYAADAFLEVLVRRDGEDIEFEIQKAPCTSLGIAFEYVLFDGVRTCGAHCIFCFIDQLPSGLRKSLYLKDDDFRLSFLHGSFVTLANVSDADLQRIVTQRLSPLYISVHTTDSASRQLMLGRAGPDILAQIDTLAQGRIILHTQIVLCRGINDGKHLERTVFDLAARFPAVRSIAVVPAGISKHRRKEAPIGAMDAQYSAEILRRIKQWQRRFVEEKGTRLVWAADEFYLSAGIRVPEPRAYEHFPQIENGVGLVRRFKESAYRANQLIRSRRGEPLSSDFGLSSPDSLTVSVATGRLAAPLLRQWADSIPCENVRLKVFPVTNRLFGKSVTVAGLMAGRDVIDELRGKRLGDAVLVPSVALCEGAFLDDVTLGDVEEALQCRTIAVEPAPCQLARRIWKRAKPPKVSP